MTLEVKQLVKTYGETKVLHGISLKAASGKAFGLLGGNGAGKTTTIRSILGLLDYDAGEVQWDGVPITANRPRIGYLPEERGLYPKEKVSEQLVYFARLEGMSRAGAIQAMRRWLERLGIEEYEHKKVEQLSKGNQQKVQIISALLHDPELIILDEPFSGLDPVNSELLASVVKELIDHGKTLIFSSHQMGHVEQFCEDICILKRGKMMVSGNLMDIKRSYGRTNLLLRSERDLMPHLVSYGLASERISSNAHEWQLEIAHEEQGNQLLQQLTRDGINLLKFEIKEPTLHEIFIEKVGEVS